MADFRIVEVSTRKDVDRFVDLAFRIYRKEPGWSPILRADVANYLRPETNGFIANGPFLVLIAVRDDGKCLSRVLAGVDEKSNAIRGVRNGWFSLFECIPGEELAATAMMDRVSAFMKEHGVVKVTGPLSPNGSDEFKGFLKVGRDHPAPYLCSWNPEWYTTFFQKLGYTDIHRLFGYRIEKADIPFERYQRVVAYAKERYGFRVDPIDLKHLERELEDIGRILEVAILESWEDLTPPSIDELRKQADSLKKVADPNLIMIARRVSDNAPIGFDLILPDYGDVLRHLNGRMGLIGSLKFLYYRRKITGVRGFAQFVVPEYKHKGVMSAIFLEVFDRGIKKGYCWGDASTVGEENTPSLANIQSLGAKLYKEYWVMSRDLR
jgi:GNAT superfamily N-acetyltransferase